MAHFFETSKSWNSFEHGHVTMLRNQVGRLKSRLELCDLIIFDPRFTDLTRPSMASFQWRITWIGGEIGWNWLKLVEIGWNWLKLRRSSPYIPICSSLQEWSCVSAGIGVVCCSVAIVSSKSGFAYKRGERIGDWSDWCLNLPVYMTMLVIERKLNEHKWAKKPLVEFMGK